MHEHADEHFLRQVVGAFAVVEHAAHQVDHSSLVAAHQLRERTLVLLRHPRHQIFVRETQDRWQKRIYPVGPLRFPNIQRDSRASLARRRPLDASCERARRYWSRA